MAFPNTESNTRVFDLSRYTSEELVHLWSSPEGMTNQALLAASLTDELTFYTVTARMVREPMDVLSGDNVNWAMANLTEEILISIIPLVDVSQAAGALLVLGWIQWVKGRLDLAMDTLQRIEEQTNFSSAFYSVMYRKVADAVLPAVMTKK
jgi:hypothetical protein